MRWYCAANISYLVFGCVKRRKKYSVDEEEVKLNFFQLRIRLPSIYEVNPFWEC